MPSPDIIRQDIHRMASVFFDQGTSPVYIVVARGRVYCGNSPAQRFPESDEVPVNTELKDMVDLESFLRDLVV